MGEATRILLAAEPGSTQAAADLLPLVYDDLRRLAAAKMTREATGQTLQATALVHEAYLRLVDTKRVQSWSSRGHFFAAAAEAMRRILVERARRKNSLKEGGGFDRVSLADVPDGETDAVDAIALSDALDKLEAAHPRPAAILKLRYFAGLTQSEAAEALGISTSTADNDWAYARSWLRVELG